MSSRKRLQYTFFTKIFTAFALLVAALMALCGVAFDKSMQRYAEERIGEARLSNQARLEEYMQELTGSLQRDALNLSQILAQSEISSKSAAIGELREAQSKLSAANRTNTMLLSMYLYLEEPGYVVTSYNGCYRLESFLDQEWLAPYQSLDSIDNSTWMSVRRVHSLYSPTGKDEGEPVLTYIYRLSSFTTPGLSGVLIFNVDAKELASRLNAGYDGRQEYVQVIDETGSVLCDPVRSQMGMNLSEETHIGRILKDPKKSGYFTTDIDGEMMLVSWYRSEFEDWIFVDVSSVETMNTLAQSYVNGLLLILGGILIAGLLGAFGLSRYLYNPVKQLTDEILRGEVFAGNRGDLALLKRAISNMKQEEERLRKNQAEDKTKQEEAWLRTALLNGYQPQEAPEGLKALVSGMVIRVAYLRFYLQDERWGKMDGEESCYFRDLLCQLWSQMRQENQYTGREVYVGKRGVYLLILGGEERELCALLGRYNQYVQENFQIHMAAGVSRACENLQEAMAAGEKALRASGRVFFRGWGSVITEEDLPMERAEEYVYPAGEEKELMESLDSGNEKWIRQAVGNYCQQIRQMPSLTVEHAVLMLHQLTGTILQKLSERVGDEEQVMEYSRRIHRIFSIQGYSLQEFEQDFGDCLCTLFGCVRQEEGGAGLYSQILAYIQEHYRENIGANEIAEALGISYSYTRKIFKEHSGVSPSDYIHQLRIQDAKRILMESSKPVIQIAEEVGYNNDQSFLRAFKKWVGMSPAVYRKERNS